MVTGVVRGNLHYKEPEVCRADRPEHSGNFRGQLTFQYHNKNSTETLPFVRAEGFVSTPACIIDFIPKGEILELLTPVCLLGFFLGCLGPREPWNPQEQLPSLPSAPVVIADLGQ